LVLDETGQKQCERDFPGDAAWADVTALTVAALDLEEIVADEAAIYHVYDDQTGMALLPEETVADVVPDDGESFRVRLAMEMKPAIGGES